MLTIDTTMMHDLIIVHQAAEYHFFFTKIHIQTDKKLLNYFAMALFYIE